MNHSWRFVSFGFIIFCISINTVPSDVGATPDIGPFPKIVDCLSGSAPIGGKGQIRCNLYGYPKPSIFYRKADNELYVPLFQNRFSLEINPITSDPEGYSFLMTLNISNAKITDEGWFEFFIYSEKHRKLYGYYAGRSEPYNDIAYFKVDTSKGVIKNSAGLYWITCISILIILCR